ncbi:MAG: hypothetical protein K0R98_862 [Rickettsiaceae bacterium]|jgi:hypothetical protein|nr:hypothetical protein [Rickettsiaceae bacterium]
MKSILTRGATASLHPRRYNTTFAQTLQLPSLLARGVNPFQLGEVTKEHLNVITPSEWLKKTWGAEPSAEVVKIIDEERDVWQSFMKGFPFDYRHMLDYHTTLAQINGLEGGPNILHGVVGGGGTRGQLPIMAGRDPYKLAEDITKAEAESYAKKISDNLSASGHLVHKLHYVELLRAENADALTPRDIATFRKHVREKASICKKNGIIYEIRAFDFANRHAINLYNLTNIVEELHSEGFNNILINYEHSLQPTMTAKEVGQTIVGSALLGHTSAGGKAFAPNIPAYKWKEIIEYVDSQLKIAAEHARESGDFLRANQLNNFAITVHAHYSELKEQKQLPILSKERTDTFGVGKTVVDLAFQLKRPVRVHSVCPIKVPTMDEEFLTHISHFEILNAMREKGVAVNDAQIKLFKELQAIQQRGIDKHKSAWVESPTQQSKPTSKPGGGIPAEKQCVERIAKNLKIEVAAAQKLFDDEYERVARETVVTCHVTPGKKAVDDLIVHFIENVYHNRERHDGKFTEIAVDVLREQPKNIKDQQALLKAYAQHLNKILEEKQNQCVLTNDQVKHINLLSLDKLEIRKYLAGLDVSENDIGDILEAAGQKSRPTNRKSNEHAIRAGVSQIDLPTGMSPERAELIIGMYDNLGREALRLMKNMDGISLDEYNYWFALEQRGGLPKQKPGELDAEFFHRQQKDVNYLNHLYLHQHLISGSVAPLDESFSHAAKIAAEGGMKERA